MQYKTDSKKKPIESFTDLKMKIQKFISQHLKKRLKAHKSLVIYDPDGLYWDIVMELSDDQITVVDGSASTIIGRETAIDAWCRM